MLSKIENLAQKKIFRIARFEGAQCVIDRMLQGSLKDILPYTIYTIINHYPNGAGQLGEIIQALLLSDDRAQNLLGIDLNARYPLNETGQTAFGLIVDILKNGGLYLPECRSMLSSLGACKAEMKLPVDDPFIWLSDEYLSYIKKEFKVTADFFYACFELLTKTNDYMRVALTRSNLEAGLVDKYSLTKYLIPMLNSQESIDLKIRQLFCELVIEALLFNFQRSQIKGHIDSDERTHEWIEYKAIKYAKHRYPSNCEYYDREYPSNRELMALLITHMDMNFIKDANINDLLIQSFIRSIPTFRTDFWEDLNVYILHYESLEVAQGIFGNFREKGDQVTMMKRWQSYFSETIKTIAVRSERADFVEFDRETQQIVKNSKEEKKF